MAAPGAIDNERPSWEERERRCRECFGEEAWEGMIDDLTRRESVAERQMLILMSEQTFTYHGYRLGVAVKELGQSIFGRNDHDASRP